MRPLALYVEGFTSFREATQLDLAGLDLFAIAGPTGAGKTSLLDAIVFCLYGTVPRMKKNQGELISLGRDRLSVRLDFSLGAERYRVSRVMRRGARSIQSTAQLERLVGDAEPEPKADGVKEVDQELARLVGLSYDAFTQAAILPQGEFARFLHSQPKDRRAILRDLLRLQVYERMRQRADAEAKACGATVATLSGMLDSAYAGVTAQAAAEAEREYAERRDANADLATRRQRREHATAELRVRVEKTRALDGARRELAALEVRALEMKADESRLAAARKADAVLPRLEAAEAAARDAARAAEAARQSEARFEKASAAHAARVEEHVAAETAAQALPELDRRIEALAQAVALAAPLAAARRAVEEAAGRARHARAEAESAEPARLEAEKRAEALTDEARHAAEAVTVRDAAEAKAETAFAKAEAALREAERRHAAAHLRAGLRRGDPCPVCERPLAKAPSKRTGAAETELEDRRAAFRGAEEARTAARKQARAARAEAETARAAAERAGHEARGAAERAEARRQAAAEAEAAEERSRHAVGSLEAQLAVLTDEAKPAEAQRRLRVERERLAEARDRARTAEQAAATEHATAEAEASSARRRAEEARESAELTASRAAEAAAAAGFADATAARTSVLPAAEQKRLAEVVETYGRDRHAVEQRVAALAAELKGTSADPAALEKAEAELARLRDEHDAGVREESRLQHRLADLKQRLEQAAAHREELERSRERHSTYQQLARDLQSQNFQEFLLRETFDVLVEGASRRLLELTGRYALEYDDNAFHVRDDDNAGERRRVETLSGGETFLASLALALELSQQVQRSAGAVHLDSLFIDEGFGALDAETLDVVAEALESLPTGGRMVGVVTHITELTRRLPARIVVRKDGPVSRAEVQVA